MSKLEVMKIDWTAHSEQDTIQLAGWLGSRALPGTMLALDGDLGAGRRDFPRPLQLPSE